MGTVLTIIRNTKRTTSLLTLSVVFLFLAGATPHQETRTRKTNFLKSSSEFAILQLLSSPKEGSAKATTSDFLFHVDQGETISKIAQTQSLSKKPLNTNSFQRNVFYVYISINAP